MTNNAKLKKLVKESSSETKTKKIKRHMGMKTKNRISNGIVYAILIIMSIIWLIPFVFILFESFRCESTYQVGYIVPKQWGFDNYVKLFTKTDFPKWFLNTFIIGLVCAVVQTIIVLSMSYTLSRLRFKGRKFLMNFMLILGMFPGFLTMILLFRLLSDLGLTGVNAVPGLILVYVASSGMGYYVSKGFFDTIPKTLDEAARVDGATRLQIFYKIIMPMAKPIIIYTILTAFMAPWGDFMFARMISNLNSAGMNVAAGLQNMISTPQSLAANYTTFCAGGVVVAIPIALLFMFLQKYYVEGVTGGAVKG
ncbi:MAG: sugar ABC transporter permease [Anaeroplasma sp.]